MNTEQRHRYNLHFCIIQKPVYTKNIANKHRDVKNTLITFVIVIGFQCTFSNLDCDYSNQLFENCQ